MAPRKPPAERWESFVDRQIREAQERGEFDDLPLAGKPLPDLHRPHDDLWWIRRKMKEEDLTYLPPALQLRRDVESAREAIASMRTEAEVRQVVGDLNERIRYANRTALHGPASTVVPLDVEEVVDQWRRSGPGAAR